MTGPKVTLSEAERQVARVVDPLETARWQLLGIALSLSDDEAEAEAEVRRVLECILADRVLPALGDLRSLLPRS